MLGLTNSVKEFGKRFGNKYASSVSRQEVVVPGPRKLQNELSISIF